MIDDVMNSLNLDPTLARLGNANTNITNTIGNTIGCVMVSNNGSIASRSLEYNLQHNILYSVNKCQGDTHTNRILAQNGHIIEQGLDNDGATTGKKTVGNYKADMQLNGFNRTVSTTIDGETVSREEFVYAPFPGLIVTSLIYFEGDGSVVGTRVISEGTGGGSSTMGEDV